MTTALPTPSSLVPRCTRFSAEGDRCTNRTPRKDGWCGQCDGYARAGVTQEEITAFKPRRPRVNPSWTEIETTLASDEAYDLDIAPAAVQEFTQAHLGTTEAHAGPQIRSLLEDLLRHGYARRSRSGLICLEHKTRRLQGYRLYVHPSHMEVVSYETNYLERTYAQQRAGIKARKHVTPLAATSNPQKEN